MISTSNVILWLYLTIMTLSFTSLVAIDNILVYPVTITTIVLLGDNFINVNDFVRCIGFVNFFLSYLAVYVVLGAFIFRHLIFFNSSIALIYGFNRLLLISPARNYYIKMLSNCNHWKKPIERIIIVNAIEIFTSLYNNRYSIAFTKYIKKLIIGQVFSSIKEAHSYPDNQCNKPTSSIDFNIIDDFDDDKND